MGACSIGAPEWYVHFFKCPCLRQIRRMNKAVSFFIVCLLLGSLVSTAQADSYPVLLWTDTASQQQKDTYVAFRGSFNLTEDQQAEIRLTGASWYVVWVNGRYVTEGPDRYLPAHPEHTTDAIALKKGKNVIAVQVHYEGVTTRLLKNILPFLYCKIVAKHELKPDWKCQKLEAYKSGVARINPQLAWVEWCDTRALPAHWQQTDFDDSGWETPVPVNRNINAIAPVAIGSVKQLEIKPQLIASGNLVETYGYERDNISARFFLRDLQPSSLPPQGIWRRYDLGRVRLGRPKFVLDLPAGTVVEFGYSEYLEQARVLPWITLSGGDSHNMDHYIARGGRQEFFPLTPKGGRYVEVHILAPKQGVQFIEEAFLERTYHDAPIGTFTCSDTALNNIWNVGIETYRACTEDAVIDNPTRERGQWTGDVTTVGMMIASAGFTDLRLIKRGLVQSALSARNDGMVAGLCPGGDEYLSSYALQWISGCINYYNLTGDRALLQYLYPYAVKDLQAFEKFKIAGGISKKAGWAFIDWGYVTDTGSTDGALNMHYALALQDWLKWCALLGHQEEIQKYTAVLNEMTALLRQSLTSARVGNAFDFDKIGYHKTVLAARIGFFKAGEMKDVIAYLKKHILNCFPNNPDTPRLSDPQSNNAQIITPYFAFYSFPLLVENGEIEFVLEQYKKSWGWALQDNRTTWLEVFDPRWSHCHQWSGSPTWQLSKYILGLSAAYNQGKNTYELSFVKNSLAFAKGRIPVQGTDQFIEVSWQKKNGNILYSITSQVPVWIKLNKALTGRENLVKVNGRYQLIFKE